VLNVDEDLLNWGASVAETFREMGLAKRAAGVRSGVRKSSVYGNYTYTSDVNGYYWARSNEGVKTQMDREEQARATAVRFQSWKEVEDSTASIRRQMTQKYRLEF
jgi:hypothetical protein